MRVLLTRPQAQAEELGTVLEAHGVEWLGEPLLKIVPVTWDTRILMGKAVILLTSANASRELLRLPDIRRDIPIFSVGQGTAGPLCMAGFSNVRAAGGTALDLISFVRRHADPQAGRLLHLSGRDITIDLATCLAQAGFSVDRMIVYKACAVEQLSSGVLRELCRNNFDTAVFMSARTAAVFCSLAISSGIVQACVSMTAVVISRKVAEVLRAAGFRRVVVATSPSLDSVLDAILRSKA